MTLAFFQIKQKTVQTLLKWLFWTSINLDIIKQNIILAEVFVSIPCALYPCWWAFNPCVG